MKTLKLNNQFLNKGDIVILGLSGGRDSMTLLDLLLKQKIKVIIAHINHKKRAASEIEEKYIINYAKDNNIICETISYLEHNHSNFQSQAHHFRYEFFYKLAKKYNAKYILTAHQADDLAETIMLRLITGSNLYGYGGISLFTPYKDVLIYHPLLEYSREDINDYVKNNNIVYFEDESNNQNDYLRNRIRHEIIPLFKQENPNFLNSINNYSNILKESFSFIRENTINYLNNKLEIELNSFSLLHNALKKDIISYLLEKHNIKPSYNLINDLINLINNKKPQLDYNLLNDYLFVKRYDKAYITKKTKQEFNSITLNLGETKIFDDNLTLSLTENNSNSNAKSLKIWYNDLDLPLTVRYRLPGDYLEFNFGKKKIKDFFIDKKIEKEKREKYPIILNNKGQVIAIIGLINLSKGNRLSYLICEEK